MSTHACDHCDVGDPAGDISWPSHDAQHGPWLWLCLSVIASGGCGTLYSVRSMDTVTPGLTSQRDQGTGYRGGIASDVKDTRPSTPGGGRVAEAAGAGAGTAKAKAGKRGNERGGGGGGAPSAQQPLLALKVYDEGSGALHGKRTCCHSSVVTLW